MNIDVTADNLTDEQIRDEWAISLRFPADHLMHRATIIALEMSGPEAVGAIQQAIQQARQRIADAINARVKAVR